ncbi:MAG: hypothetical protein V7L04_27805 [Nostoc sp.]|uniref:hypothetical protein n=1 Tax=Nostoc sp. TaxID=1180 RepID=UPI002FFAEF43
MDVIRDVLDNQLFDRNQRKMGKVDGIVMELRDREPPRLAYIEVGVTTVTRQTAKRLTHELRNSEPQRRGGHGEIRV